MSRTHPDGIYTCVSHQLGPPGSLWSQVTAEEKTGDWCSKRLVTGDFLPVPLLVQVKTLQTSRQKSVFPLATKQGTLCFDRQEHLQSLLLRDPTHTAETSGTQEGGVGLAGETE